MIALANGPCFQPSIADLQARFLKIRPRIELHARIFFRGVKCHNKKEDYIAETLALAWQWFLRLVAQGKDPASWPSVLASYAARAVKSGRRLCSKLKAKDPLNELTQQKHDFTIEGLPSSTANSYHNLFGDVSGQRKQDSFEERLQDDTQTPVPDQAAFRIDWPSFCKSLSPRDRRLAEVLSLGHGGKKAAAKFGLSPGRVTHIRQRLCKEWYNLHGELPPFERQVNTAGRHF